MSMDPEYLIHLATPHEKQKAFIECGKKRIAICAGRRGGKTIGSATLAVKKFLDGRRVLYAAPTEDQISSFWYEVKRALYEPIEAKVLEKNETMHTIELPRTKQRIRAKTAFNADTLRGDYADLLILDEFQLMNEDAWEVVGAPMLADNDGDAVFIYTPPSLKTRTFSKAKDPRHASKMFKKAQTDQSGRWAAFHFTSFDNPYINQDALTELAGDMTALAYRQEIMAEDVDEAPGALWTRETIEQARVGTYPELDYIVVGVDPSATSGGDEAGIIVAGRADQSYYIIGDHTLQGSPLTWAGKAIDAFTLNKANIIVAESNQGGEMVTQTIHNIDRDVPVKLVFASRGKATRAEPISALYERGLVHHVGQFYALEDEMCMWVPGDRSPNRMDALVWALTELSRGSGTKRVAYSIQG
jgi:phage terminase large subunit-like protein